MSKLCTECEHYVTPRRVALGQWPEVTMIQTRPLCSVHIAKGMPVAVVTPSDMRGTGGACGRAGLLFKRRAD